MQESKQNYEINLVKNFGNSSSKLYNYINSLQKRNNLPFMMYNENSSATTNGEKASLFNTYFKSVFTKSNFVLPSSSDIVTPDPIISDITISEEAVYKSLSSLNPTKAMGMDNIGPKVLKICAASLTIPLHHLFLMCLSQCKIPSEWKIHKITPVYKSGDPTLIKNYRPISLLSSISKVFERLIYNEISDFVTSTISPSQFGFLPNHSCLQQLLLFTKSILDSHESKNQRDVVYLDFRKAFDSVPHQELLLKLYQTGITGNLWKLFEDYLTSRVQCVAVENSTSDVVPVTSGVPQGSILGPLFFIIYINDLPIPDPSLRLFTFADDTKLTREIKDLSDCQLLQNGINSLYDWSSKWKLPLNLQKCNIIQFSSSVNYIPFTYKIKDIGLSSTCNIKDLGINFSNNLSWDKHYNMISSKAYKQLGLLKRTFGYDSYVTTKKILYLTLVRSKLTYCSQVWRPYLIKDINLLERIQRRATRFIANNSSLEYKERLTMLNILPLMMTFEIADILFFIKHLKTPLDNFNIRDYILFSYSNTRSSTHFKLRHTISHTNRYGHFYFKRLPRLWNALPSIDINTSFTTIRKTLLNHFWTHFTLNFQSNNPCTYHICCPCHKCSHIPSNTNFT